jgi:hypothetical protein
MAITKRRFARRLTSDADVRAPEANLIEFVRRAVTQRCRSYVKVEGTAGAEGKSSQTPTLFKLESTIGRRERGVRAFFSWPSGRLFVIRITAI